MPATLSDALAAAQTYRAAAQAALADRLVCMRHGRIVADLRRGSDAFDAVLRGLRAD